MSSKAQTSSSTHIPIQHSINNGKTWESTMTLESREERVKLLKEGYKDKDIEMLYLKLNSMKVMGVNWDE